MNNYLEELSRLIKKQLPSDEYNDVMQYYTEYFEDAGIEKEADVIKELGSPEDLAARILEEYRGKQLPKAGEQQRKKGLSAGWIIFIAIIGSPLWLSLFIVGVVLVIAIAAVILTFGAVGIAGIIGGICMLVSGIAVMIEDAPLAFLMIGYGFLLGAIGCALIMLTVFIVRLIIRIFKKIRRKKLSKQEKEEA